MEARREIQNFFPSYQVLDAGHLKEFDAPYILLGNPRSIFSQLVEQTGPGEAKRLYEIASDKYHEQHSIIWETPEAGDENDASKTQNQLNVDQSDVEINVEAKPDAQSGQKSQDNILL